MAYANPDNDKFFFDLIESNEITILNDYIHVFIKSTNKLYNLAGDRTKTGNDSKYVIFNYKSKSIFFHRLVYMFHYRKIPNQLVIDHLDGNKWNNHIDNLEAVTEKINHTRARENGLIKMTERAKQLSKERNLGEKCIFSKLSDQDAIDIRFKFAKMNYNLLQLAEEYGVTKRNIKNLILGINFPHLPILTKKGDTKLITEPRLSEKEKSDIIDFYSSSKKDNQPPISMRKLAKVFNRDPSTVSTIIKNYLAF